MDGRETKENCYGLVIGQLSPRGKGPIWKWAGSPRTLEDKRFDAKRRETQKKVHKLGNGINMCKRNGGICLILEVSLCMTTQSLTLRAGSSYIDTGHNKRPAMIGPALLDVGVRCCVFMYFIQNPSMEFRNY